MYIERLEDWKIGRLEDWMLKGGGYREIGRLGDSGRLDVENNIKKK